jgi:hypothetical protein
MTQHKCMYENKAVVCQTWTVLELGPSVLILNQTMFVRCNLYSLLPIMSISHASYFDISF